MAHAKHTTKLTPVAEQLRISRTNTTQTASDIHGRVVERAAHRRLVVPRGSAPQILLATSYDAIELKKREEGNIYDG